MRDFLIRDKLARRLLLLYAAEAILCTGAVIASVSFQEDEILAFPYGQIGAILRMLSVSGSVGNVLAWVLYILISLIPAAVWVLLYRRGKTMAEDLFLWAFSVLLLIFLYMTVNPSVLFALTGASTKVVSVSMLVSSCAVTLDSLILLYFMIRLLHYCRKIEDQKLIRNLRYFFYVVGFVLVMVFFTGGLSGFIEAMEKVKEGNTGFGASFTCTYVLLALKQVVEYLPVLAEWILALFAIWLLSAMEQDIYGEETVKAAERMARICPALLLVTLSLTVLCNILNLFWQSESYQVSLSVNVPLFYIGYSIVLLLISRSLAAGRRLKQDHDLFI